MRNTGPRGIGAASAVMRVVGREPGCALVGDPEVLLQPDVDGRLHLGRRGLVGDTEDPVWWRSPSIGKVSIRSFSLTRG